MGHIDGSWDTKNYQFPSLGLGGMSNNRCIGNIPLNVQVKNRKSISSLFDNIIKQQNLVAQFFEPPGRRRVQAIPSRQPVSNKSCVYKSKLQTTAGAGACRLGLIAMYVLIIGYCRVTISHSSITRPIHDVVLELRDVTCHMGSHSVTCHPTQVNASALTQPVSWYSIYLPGGMEG